MVARNCEVKFFPFFNDAEEGRGEEEEPLLDLPVDPCTLGLDSILQITAAGHLLMGTYCEATRQESCKSFRKDRICERMKTS